MIDMACRLFRIHAATVLFARRYGYVLNRANDRPPVA
jgi:hypothetical protein